MSVQSTNILRKWKIRKKKHLYTVLFFPPISTLSALVVKVEKSRQKSSVSWACSTNSDKKDVFGVRRGAGMADQYVPIHFVACAIYQIHDCMMEMVSLGSSALLFNTETVKQLKATVVKTWSWF